MSSHGNATPQGRPLRIVVAVDGSATADRAVSHALSLVEGRPGSEIFLVNVQTMETLDVSDISAVMTVEADRRLAANQSRSALQRQSSAEKPGPGLWRGPRSVQRQKPSTVLCASLAPISSSPARAVSAASAIFFSDRSPPKSSSSPTSR